ncbi:MAG: dihydrofolate reductase [Myxococcales bacterium]|nr:dihydrofolate reductase [Myxococcales bacterium]
MTQQETKQEATQETTQETKQETTRGAEVGKPEFDPAQRPSPPDISAEFEFFSEQFADSRVLRYQIYGFESLTPQQKQLAYYLYEAALSGRDIIWDQKYKHNLVIRRTLEAIYRTYKGDKTSASFRQLHEYLKLVWFARGIHHDYSSQKYTPGFTAEFFAEAARQSDASALPLQEGEDVEALIAKLTPILFDPAVDAKRVNRGDGVDQVQGSAVNFYEGVTQAEVEAFYKQAAADDDETPVSHGLNSKLVKQGGAIVEKVWKVGGMYGPAIERVVYWLERAVTVAENPAQRDALSKLVTFYKTGDLRAWDEYNIAWVKDTESRLDVVNGFIEVYNDPLGYKGTFESVVSIKDLVASERIAKIGANAQWFEDHAPIEDKHKKQDVTGISAKVITVVVESGDAAPTTPIGINLPNANWIRQQHGSKSVNLGNIVTAYDESRRTSGLLEEFASSPEEIERGRAFGPLASTLKVDMHEVIGHASGAIEPGVKTPKETLKSYASALEEGRADLVALYFVLDPKLVELGLMPSLDVGKAAYDSYIRNGLMIQLARLELGADIEESHMRNRQMVAKWAFERGAADTVIERVERGGKTYFVIRDYERLRALFGELLREIQRIKSTGDFAAGKALIEGYGVKVDAALHKQVKQRYATLGIAPYSGFIQPRLVPVEQGGSIVDVKVEYPEDFTAQQLEHSEKYSLLPDYN